MNVRIVIDSTADIRPELKARFAVVPLTIHFGDAEYVDGVDIDHRKFYEMLVESDVVPTTSQPTPAAFEKVFAEAVEAGESVVAITVASELSGTYQSATIAAADYPDRVFVVDGRSAAIGTGKHLHQCLTVSRLQYPLCRARVALQAGHHIFLLHNYLLP